MSTNDEHEHGHEALRERTLVLVLLGDGVLEEAEDVVQDVEAGRLLRGEHDRLREGADLALGLAQSAQHADEDGAADRLLAVQVGHVHGRVGEVERGDALGNGLHAGRTSREPRCQQSAQMSLRTSLPRSGWASSPSVPWMKVESSLKKRWSD